MENRPVPLLLLLLALPVFFIYLGANSIWDANEAFYVETPRQMVLTGDYLNPSFNGQPRFNKPVLSYWVVAGLYHAFGESVGVERFGIALGAVGIIFATFLIGRAWRSTPTGVLAALIVATSPSVVMHARRIFIDVYLTLFTALALACFVLAERRPERRRRYLLLMYVAIGLGVLTKGPVALVLPALALIVWLGVERRLGDLRRLMLPAGALIVLAIVLPWYVAVYAQHGWTHIREFFVDENLGRYTASLTPDDRAVWFYVPVLLGELFPWAPLLILPLVGAVRAWRGHKSETDRVGASIRRLLWLWIAAFVVVFSFSRTKQDLYIFPVTPAVAALVADALIAGARARARGLSTAFLAVCAASAALAAGAYWLFNPGAGPYALPGATAYAVLLAATGASAFALWSLGRRHAAVAALAGGFIALNYLFVARVLPGLEPLKPVPSLSRTLAARASTDARIANYRMVLPSLVYYTRRAVPELASLDDAVTFLSEPRESWIVTSNTEWAEIQARVPGACVADRRPLFDTKLSNVLSRTPPPDVVLVTNRCR